MTGINATNGLGLPNHYSKKDAGEMFAILLKAAIGIYQTLTQNTLSVMNDELQKQVNRENEVSNEITKEENAVNSNPDDKNAKALLNTLKNSLQVLQTKIQSLNARDTSMMQTAGTYAALMNKDVSSKGQMLLDVGRTMGS